MSTQSTEYISCSRICCGELPAQVILCIPTELVLPHVCPEGEEGEDPVDETTEYTFIYAELALETKILGSCNTNSWRYVFTYNDAQLVEGALLTGDAINGVVCRDCLTEWVLEIVGDEPYIRTNEDGSKDFISPHGCVYRIVDGE